MKILDRLRAKNTDIRGSIDGIENGLVRGWLWRPSSPRQAEPFEVVVNGEVRYTGVADEFRKDLVTNGIGTGNHAFSFPSPLTPQELENGTLFQLRSRRDGLCFPARPMDLRAKHSKPGSGSFQITGMVCNILCGQFPSLAAGACLPHLRIDGKAHCSMLRTAEPEVLVALGFDQIVEGFAVYVEESLRDGEQHLIELVDNRTGAVLASSTLALNSWPLFDKAFYLLQNPDVKKAGVEAIFHYLTFGLLEIGSRAPGNVFPRNPHPVFDANYYYHHYADVGEAGVEPTVHFLSHGWAEGRSPNALFDTPYYLSQVDDTTGNLDPVSHYCVTGWRVGHNPHRVFDTSFYVRNYPVSSWTLEDPLSDYLHFGFREGRNPHPLFDNNYYRKRNRLHAQNSLVHYLTEGFNQGHGDPNYWYSEAISRKQLEVVDSPTLPDFVAQQPIACAPGVGDRYDQLAASLQQRRRSGLFRGARRTKAIITSHDASRTGAPLIILNIVRQLTNRFGIDCYVFLDAGGDLLADFEEVAQVFDCQNLRRQHGVHNLAPLIKSIDEPGRTFALCNSAQTISLMELMSSLEIPIYCLIHEFAQAYKAERYRRPFDVCREVVFPAELVRQAAVTHLADEDDIEPQKARIIPQGLFNPQYLAAYGPASRQQVCAELEIDEDACIVLGCGYVDLRKGCDLFVATAQRIRARNAKAKVCFVWLGTLSSDDRTSTQFWIDQDIRIAGLEQSVKFIGARDDVLPYFRAADIFLMVSRLDPFPCVVLEAMAAAMPVIAFTGATGSADVIDESTGFLVDYLNIDSVAEKVELLMADKALRVGMGEAARDRIASDYTYDSYVDRLLRMIGEDVKWPLLGSFASGQNRTHAPTRQLFMICSDWSLSGVNSVNSAVATQLEKLGWTVEILFTQTREIVERKTNLPDESFYPQLPFRFVREPGDDYQKLWEKLQDIIEAAAPCVVWLAYDYLTSGIVPAFSDSVGVILPHQSDDMEYYEHTHRLGRYCNSIIAVSEKIASEISSLDPGLSEMTTVVPNSSVWLADTEVKRPARSEVLRLVYTGRLVDYQKRVSDFLPLIQELDSRNINYQLTLVGADFGSGLMEHLTEVWTDKLASGQVRLPGRMKPEQVRDELLASDCFVLLSEFEGMPLSLVEAMAFGSVPLVTDIASGVPELIDQAENGFVVKNRDWGVFADHICSLAADSELLQRLSDQARKTIRERGFTVEQVGAAYSDIGTAILDQVANGEYQRPAVLRWQSAVGDVLLPQVLQAHPDYLSNEGS